MVSEYWAKYLIYIKADLFLENLNFDELKKLISEKISISGEIPLENVLSNIFLIKIKESSQTDYENSLKYWNLTKPHQRNA